MLSEREQSKVESIAAFRSGNPTLVTRAQKYQEDVAFLLSIIRRYETVERMVVEDRLELADLRTMKTKLVEFVTKLGLNEGPIG